MERNGRVDARPVLRVAAPLREVAPARRTPVECECADIRRILARAGGAEHLPHNNGVIAVFVAPVDGRHLIVDVHRDGKRHRRRFGRRLRIISRGTHIRVVEQRVPCVFAHDAVHTQRVLLLECLHRVARVPQKIAADVAGIVPQFRQAGLHELDFFALGLVVLQFLDERHRRRGRRGGGFIREVHSGRGRRGGRRRGGRIPADGITAEQAFQRLHIRFARNRQGVRRLEQADGFLRRGQIAPGNLARVVAQRHQANLRLPHVLAHASQPQRAILRRIDGFLRRFVRHARHRKGKITLEVLHRGLRCLAVAPGHVAAVIAQIRQRGLQGGHVVTLIIQGQITRDVHRAFRPLHAVIRHGLPRILRRREGQYHHHRQQERRQRSFPQRHQKHLVHADIQGYDSIVLVFRAVCKRIFPHAKGCQASCA